MRIQLWRGYHDCEVRDLIAQAWSNDDRLLILCPPTLSLPFAGFEFLPEGPVEYYGTWPDKSFAGANGSWGPVERPVLGLFTTGTSAGQPKLVLYSKRCIRASLNGILRFFAADRIDSIFCYPQPFHTFGLLLGYILSLERGLDLVAPSGKYSSAAHDERLSAGSPGLLTLGTPTHFQDLMAYARTVGRQPLPSYSCIIGGAAVPVNLWRRLRSELAIEAPSIGYGATEASPGVAHLPAGQEPREDREVGYPLSGLKMTLHPGRGYEFSGESVCLAMVYADRIQYPSSIFVADDLHRREDGVLVFDSRSDLVLNRGGEKFALEQIEECVRQTGVGEVLGFAVPHPRLGFELGLLLVGPADMARVVVSLQERFQVRFDPANFRTVNELPRNASQKYDRQAAAALL